MRFRIRTVFVLVQKEDKKTETYLRNAYGWRDLLQIWNVASHHRRALPQQIWCSSDKRSWIYECMNIATLLFLLIYSPPFASAPGFLAARYTTMCLDLFLACSGFVFTCHKAIVMLQELILALRLLVLFTVDTSEY